MSLSLNNPLIIGDINKKTKEDISQIKQDIGDLSQLDTADKSSLVNALNEAIDSTLNGASRDLDNLSDVGNDKLRSLNSYANNGELLTDPDGLAFVEKYAHSTFDRSKFTVVGSPSITDDGIASGFSSSSGIKLATYFNVGSYDSWMFKGEFTTGDLSTLNHEMGVVYMNANYGKGFAINKYKQVCLQLNSTNSSNWDIANINLIKSTLTLSSNTKYYYRFYFTGTTYGVDISTDKRNWTTYVTVNSTLHIYSTSTTEIFTGSAGIQYAVSTNCSYDLKEFEFIANGIPVFSGNKTGIDTIKPDDYTVVGTPTISDDGVASGFSSSNYLRIPNLNISGATNFELTTGWFSLSDASLNFIPIINWGNADDGETKFALFYRKTSGNIDLTIYQGTSSISFGSIPSAYVSLNKLFNVKIVYKDTKWNAYYKTTDSDWVQFVTNRQDNTGVTITTQRPIGWKNSAEYLTGSIDLNAFKIYVDGNLVYQPCLKIPYTESKTGSKIVDSIYRPRVNDMAEQFGYANYYTLSDTDFTLPQVELYGLIGQRTLRDSYRNGINYWELYSNRDLEQGGSCTSGVEVTFARPFADTNYVLSVPYSAKSTTAFTPTQTGDWIAKGKGLL